MYFCFRHLPWKQARKVPIIFYPGAKMRMYGIGKIEIQTNEIRFGMVEIGFPDINFGHEGIGMTIINRGKFVFEKHGARLFGGSNVHITESGVLIFKDDVKLGSFCKLFCCKRIVIGEKTRIAHECQLFDTSFHFLEDTQTGEIRTITHPIIIGSYCWIGNRTTINKGTELPDNTTVASNSLLNKDYTKIIESYSVIGGSPAKLIRTNQQRVWNSAREDKLYEEKEQIKIW